MLFSNIELLHHIFDEADFILSSCKNKTKEDVVNDPVLSRAIIRSMEIIGEASKKLIQSLNPAILISNGRKWQGPETNLYMTILG